MDWTRCKVQEWVLVTELSVLYQTVCWRLDWVVNLVSDQSGLGFGVLDCLFCTGVDARYWTGLCVGYWTSISSRFWTGLFFFF